MYAFDEESKKRFLALGYSEYTIDDFDINNF